MDQMAGNTAKSPNTTHTPTTPTRLGKFSSHRPNFKNYKPRLKLKLLLKPKPSQLLSHTL